MAAVEIHVRCDGECQDNELQERIVRLLERVEALLTTASQALSDDSAAMTLLTNTVSEVVSELGDLVGQIASLQGTIATGTVDPNALEGLATQANGLVTKLTAALALPAGGGTGGTGGNGGGTGAAALFTFTGDTNPGDVNGGGGNFVVATVVTDAGLSLYTQIDATVAVDATQYTAYTGVTSPAAAAQPPVS
jgi:hypothetical protein